MLRRHALAPPHRALDQLDAIDAASAHRPVLLFKHSTRCSISDTALHRLPLALVAGGRWSRAPARPFAAPTSRDAIAERYRVPHESPQALVMNRGRCILHASPGDRLPRARRRHAGLVGPFSTAPFFGLRQRHERAMPSPSVSRIAPFHLPLATVMLLRLAESTRYRRRPELAAAARDTTIAAPVAPSACGTAWSSSAAIRRYATVDAGHNVITLWQTM
ncbi:MAG: DUF2847 family protein [Flavobacteriales bacterium]|nr:DUF2847 family protein [Flavobacteriales bacterium]